MWFVKFNDGSEIKGKTAEGTEVPFALVLKRLADVVIMGYTIEQTTLEISLLTGKLKINEQESFGLMRSAEFLTLANVRPIYFVHERVDFIVGHNVSSIGRPLFAVIGFQGNLPDGRNIKRIVEIGPTGTFDIADS